jgi:hypothetical protein
MSNKVKTRELVTYVDFDGTALWREGLKAKYPEDLRIDGAIEVLKRFQREMTQYEGTSLHHKIVALYDNNDSSHSIISEELRSIGFSYHPESVNQVLKNIVVALENETTNDNEKENYVACLEKSRAESMVAEAEEGFESGALWAKDEAKWPELCAVVALENIGSAADFHDLSNVLSEFGLDSDYLLSQFGEQMPSKEKVMGFIKGAAKIKN